MKKPLLFFISFLLSASVLPSGTITLAGKMAGKTEKTFSIESKSQIFVIIKASLLESLAKSIEPLKWGDPITLNLPMDSIIEIKSTRDKK